MKVGDLVRHKMKEHNIYGGCVGLVVAFSPAQYPQSATVKIKWLGLPLAFQKVYDQIDLPTYNFVLVRKKNTNV